jgi:glycosyltransferase involved in cell wall biosynthesis
MNSKPIISFVLISYKQEQFIREAVEGALSQTYSPLEIILSDDCSPDRTFEIMQEMGASYSGPHKIILNRNEKNLGLGQHFNRVMDMAKGELIVMAAGDDISLPNRTDDLVNEWIASGKPSGICSDIISINQNGIIIDKDRDSWLLEKIGIINESENGKSYCVYINHPFFCLLGGSAAWSKNCWDIFGNINSDVINEDVVMSFRSSLAAGLHISKNKLVKYRRHDSNLYNYESPNQLSNIDEYFKMENALMIKAARKRSALKNMLRDIITAKRNNHNLHINLIDDIEFMFTKMDICLFYQSEWWSLPLITKALNFNKLTEKSLIKNASKILPFKSYLKTRLVFAKIKRKCVRITSLIFYIL